MTPKSNMFHIIEAYNKSSFLIYFVYNKNTMNAPCYDINIINKTIQRCELNDYEDRIPPYFGIFYLEIITIEKFLQICKRFFDNYTFLRIEQLIYSKWC